MATQLANIEKRTGKTLAQLHAILRQSGLDKHGQLVALLKEQLAMGHGDANTVVHTYRKAAAPAPAADADPLDAIYTGAKAPLRALHDALLARLARFGAFEIAPKQAYVSLRRAKQFAMVGPGTKARLEVGINLKDVEGTDRLVAQKPGGMCQFKVWLTDAAEIDKELLGWLQQAYTAAG